MLLPTLLMANDIIPKYEVRAVWLTTIGGIDWPHSYANKYDEYSIQRQKKEFTEILDVLKAANINTILLQTRIRATTIYPSNIEPWDGAFSGKPGVSPGYDPLEFAVEECHKRGMEVHAWVVTIPVGKWNSYGCKQLRKRYPNIIKNIKGEGYMNPESYKTGDYLSKLCGEIAEKYDIDGIHLDYIRYPETWKGYVNGYEARQNITAIVKQIYNTVKQKHSWIKVSCSPIGKYDDLRLYSSHGWNAYTRVYQDAQGWLRDGIMDQLYPMMYFRNKNFFPFAVDWKENSYGKTIAGGLGIYMMDRHEGNWSLSDINRELTLLRHLGMGQCFFRAHHLKSNIKGCYDLLCDEINKYPSLIPPMKWENRKSPDAPTLLTIKDRDKGCDISWKNMGKNIHYNIYASSENGIDINDAKNLLITRYYNTEVTIPSVYRSIAITSTDRYGNESAPAIIKEKSIDETIPTENNTYIRCDGFSIKVPYNNINSADILLIKSMQGQILYVRKNQRIILVNDIPNGVYRLYSVRKKKFEHFLGQFEIKRDK